jgi:hypothetical protein
MKIFLILFVFSFFIYAENGHDNDKCEKHKHHFQPKLKYKDHHVVCKQDHVIILHKRKHHKELIIEPEVIMQDPNSPTNMLFPFFAPPIFVPPAPPLPPPLIVPSRIHAEVDIGLKK